MTNKKLTLMSFGIPFIFGGGFIGLSDLTDQLQHPDDPMSSIILSSLWSMASSGTAFGLISLATVFLIIGLFRSLKKLKK